MTVEVMNAKITNVSMTMRDHGVLTIYLTVEGAGWGCNVGGYVIGKGYLGAEKFEGSAKGVEAMMRIMDTVGVDRWEDLTGKYVRIESEGWGGTIHKIGNIIKDKWFDMKEFFSEGEKNNEQ